MKFHGNDTRTIARALLLAGLGVVGFSGSFPATRVAVEGFGATEVAFGRALLAATLSALVLAARRARRPPREAWLGLGLVTLGVVLAFPLLSSAALARVDASHAAVVIALLPLATSLLAVWRNGERPHPRFWLAASAGALLVLGFVVRDPNVGVPDLWLGLAILAGAVGYAEGARLAARMPALEVIAWANLLGAPVALVGLLAFGQAPTVISVEASLGLLYLGAISSLGGFALWYAGLAGAGVARASQLQLLQPLLTLLWSVWLLGEQAPRDTWPVAIGVVLAVAMAARASKPAPSALRPSHA